MARPLSHSAAARLLAGRDPVVASLVAEAGPMRLRPPLDSHFAALVRSVVHQQLAGKAAAAIHGRLVSALGGEVSAEAVLGLSPEDLRGAGLSASKAGSLRDLAAKVLDGTVVLDPAGLAGEPDEEVIARLCTVRGLSLIHI